MKKLLSYIIPILLVASCLISPVAAISSENPHSSPAFKAQLQVISDYTNQQVPFKIESASVENIGEQEYVADYKVFVPLPDTGIKPFSSITQELDENGLTAEIKVTYFFKDTGDIKITKISGGWHGSIVDVELKNREVGITHGAYGLASDQLYWYPTTDTFSYETGWDYVPYVPHNTTLIMGPRANTEVDYRIPGMGSWDWHNLLFSIDIKPVF